MSAVESRSLSRGELVREIEALTFRLRMTEGKLHALRETDGRCAYCGAPCPGWACLAHSDLAALDPHRQAKRPRLTLIGSRPGLKTKGR